MIYLLNFISQVPTQSPPNNASLLTGIAGILIIILGTGGIYAFKKIRPEADRISVSAAEGAVIVQSKVLLDMQSELERRKKQYEEMAERLSEIERTSTNMDALKKRVEDLELERDQMKVERKQMKDKITKLEAENVRLRREVKGVKETQENGNGH